MTDLQRCPKCGGQVTFSRCKQIGSLLSKRRDCKCGHADTILIRQEIAAIIDVQKRAKKLPPKVRRRTSRRTQVTKLRNNRK